MAVVAVTFDGTRVDPLDTNTNTGHWGGSGPAPAAEAPLAYQNSLAVNKKVTSSTLAGIDFDPGTGALDMTAAANKLWYIKTYVSDAFDLVATFGVSAGIGSANNAYYVYNIAGTGAALSVYNQYPARGGYLITALDPNIAAWRDSTTGSPALATVDWFGVQCAVSTGSAKAENFAFDAIDVGTGLTLVSGGNGDAVGNFTDFVAWDQDTTTNRYGVVSGNGDFVIARGVLTIGSATATNFSDSTSIVVFPDGYHSEGLVGIHAQMSNAASTVALDNLFIGEGTRNGVAANDTRPNLTVGGGSAICTVAGTFRNFSTFDCTGATIIQVDGADIECELLIQDGELITNSIIRTNALSAIACLQDPKLGTATPNVNNTEFIQSGVGHAIEIDTAGDYTLDNLSFTGYGADTTNDAAVYVSAASGTVNITTTGTVTYRTAGATVNILNDVTITFDKLKDNTEVRIFNTGTTTEIAGIEDAIGGTTDDRSFAWTAAAATVVDYQIINKNYVIVRVEGYTVPSNATTVDIAQRLDLNV